MGLETYELDTVDNQNTEKSPYPSEIRAPTSDERDVRALARLGKKPVFMFVHPGLDEVGSAPLVWASAAIDLHVSYIAEALQG
ncbi:MAG: hypothetical protein Q9163_002177 [Psora crenata]